LKDENGHSVPVQNISPLNGAKIQDSKIGRKCPVCGKAFAREKNLLKHLNKNHGENKTAGQNMEISIREESRSADRRGSQDDPDSDVEVLHEAVGPNLRQVQKYLAATLR